MIETTLYVGIVMYAPALALSQGEETIAMRKHLLVGVLETSITIIRVRLEFSPQFSQTWICHALI